jgi:DNA-binding HxlR family transcriptional regulator
MNGKQTRKTTSAAAMVEYIVGCKWSIQILILICQGVDRPGAITRSIDGLTTKVQILEKFSYPEVPPRVEYKLTNFGRRFIAILDAIAELQHEIDANCGSITSR